MNTPTREQEARGIVKSKIDQIQTIVGNDKAKASVFATALTNLANDYNLKQCSVDSILHVGMQIVQAGLNPNKLFGQAYVVPFNLKNGGATAQLQIGYKGWISLGYRNGWIFRAIAVYECDSFSIEFAGINDKITFKPNYDKRDESNGSWVFKNLKGVIVYAKDKLHNEFSEFISFKKLEKLRLTSANQKNESKLDGIWANWAEEMYKAKAIKYVVTRLPINDSIMEAVIAESQPIVETKPAIEQTKVLNLNDKEIVSDFIDIEPTIPKGDILVKELSSRGLKDDEIEIMVSHYSLEQIDQLLEDPASIDAIVEQYFEKN